MDKGTLILSLVALVCYGVAQFAAKPVVDRIGWWNTVIAWNVIQFLVSFPAWIILRKVSSHSEVVRPLWSASGWAWCSVAAMAGMLGRLFYNIAIVRPNSVGMASTVSALYPGLTLVLAIVFFKEKVTALQWAGVLLMLVGLVLVSLPPPKV